MQIFSSDPSPSTNSNRSVIICAEMFCENSCGFAIYSINPSMSKVQLFHRRICRLFLFCYNLFVRFHIMCWQCLERMEIHTDASLVEYSRDISTRGLHFAVKFVWWQQSSCPLTSSWSSHVHEKPPLSSKSVDRVGRICTGLYESAPAGHLHSSDSFCMPMQKFNSS